MNNFIKQVIEEKFASKAQQRYFYAQASKGGKKGKKWSKWAKEFSDKTDYSKIPDKVEKEEEVDEIVDAEGNIEKGNRPFNLSSKGVTSDMTTDEFAKTTHPQQGNYGTVADFLQSLKPADYLIKYPSVANTAYAVKLNTVQNEYGVSAVRIRPEFTSQRPAYIMSSSRHS